MVHGLIRGRVNIIIALKPAQISVRGLSEALALGNGTLKRNENSMTFDEFDKIRLEFNKLEEATCYSKGVEYANSEDRLGNFKRLAQELGISPMLVAYIYFKKHMDAIAYVVKGKKELSETFESRIQDARIYLLLMYALFIEENTKSPVTKEVEEIKRQRYLNEVLPLDTSR